MKYIIFLLSLVLIGCGTIRKGISPDSRVTFDYFDMTWDGNYYGILVVYNLDTGKYEAWWRGGYDNLRFKTDYQKATGDFFKRVGGTEYKLSYNLKELIEQLYIAAGVNKQQEEQHKEM